MLAEIKNAWGWVGLEPVEVVAVNAFGNLLIRDNGGQIWRLCPEDLSCRVVADSEQAYASLLKDEEFTVDWEMGKLVSIAKAKLGSLKEGYRYCLKLPAILGGDYVESNLGVVPLPQLIRFSGDMAKQIKDLPDGTQVRLKVVD